MPHDQEHALDSLDHTGTISDTQHGTRGGGTLHPAVTGAVDGFMAAADKTKLDASGVLASTTPANVTKAAAAVGVGTTTARADHKHDITTAAPSSVGTANTEGAATSLARSDHVHNHGSQSTATHHAAATTGANGFMSSADKTKLDGLTAAQQASATATTTTTSATDGLLSEMTLTPGAGNYMAWFSTSVDHSSTNGSIYVSLYVNGVQVAHTEREYRRGAVQGNTKGGLVFNAYITGVLAGQAVEVHWRTSGATASAYQRTLNLMKVT